MLSRDKAVELFHLLIHMPDLPFPQFFDRSAQAHQACKQRIDADVHHVAESELCDLAERECDRVIIISALIVPLENHVEDKAEEQDQETGYKVIQTVDIDREDRDREYAGRAVDQPCISACHDGQAFCLSGCHRIDLPQLEDDRDHCDVHIQLDRVGRHDQRRKVKLAGKDRKYRQDQDGDRRDAALIHLSHEFGEHVVVRHDEERSGTVRNVRTEDRAVREDRDDNEEHARPVSDILDQHICITDGAGALFRGPFVPAGSTTRTGRSAAWQVSRRGRSTQWLPQCRTRRQQ